MNQPDFIPNQLPEETIPHGFGYWKPSWKLIDGKVVKFEENPHLTEELKQAIESTPSFQCNHCDFSHKEERVIKAHVTRKHKS